MNGRVIAIFHEMSFVGSVNQINANTVPRNSAGRTVTAVLSPYFSPDSRHAAGRKVIQSLPVYTITAKFPVGLHTSVTNPFERCRLFDNIRRKRRFTEEYY